MILKKEKNLFLIVSISGILIFSAGLCVFGESIIRKYNDGNWFLIGTISLILINAGICLMINSKNYR
tara:strand:+ start:2152 stop:2352 length:201 start_codon:yes stop_codon:yes gene_type:complete